MALRQGDSFQFEAHAQEALHVALLIDTLAGLEGRPGMRVVFGLQPNFRDDILISLRSIPAHALLQLLYVPPSAC